MVTGVEVDGTAGWVSVGGAGVKGACISVEGFVGVVSGVTGATSGVGAIGAEEGERGCASVDGIVEGCIVGCISVEGATVGVLVGSL